MRISTQGVLLLLLLLAVPLFAQANSSVSQLENQLVELKRQHLQLQNQAQDLNEQLEVLGNSPLVYQVLQQQRESLPRLDSSEELATRLADLRLQEFALGQQLRQARQQGRAAAHLQDQLLKLQQERQLLIHLQQEQQAFISSRRALQEQIDEQLFWIASNPSLNWSWWLSLPQHFSAFSHNLPLYLAWPESFKPRWLTALALGLPLLLLLAMRSRLAQLQKRLTLTDEQTPPSPWTPPLALLIQLAKVLPLPLALLTLAQLLQPAATDGFALEAALTALALSLLVVSLVQSLLKPQGFAQVVLGWPASTLANLNSFIRPLAWLLLPASFILALLEQQPLLLPEDPLGPLLLVALGLLLAEQFGRLMWRLPQLYQSPLLHWLVTGLLCLLPLTLAIITAQGYYYTGLQLTAQLLATLYVLVTWVITEATLLVMLKQASDKLAAIRQKEELQLAEAEASGEELASVNRPSPRLSVEQVHQQSLRLARFFLLMSFGSLFYWIWSDLFNVFSYLDSWTFLELGLNDLLVAAFILVFTLFMAANLPGLLEILVLSRLQLQQGSAYAITSLLNYAITATGFVFVLASLGVSWDKLQWLVAALSVGLGFGLQEIFANFISGLILLFERPVRVGDVVTLGNLSGRVKQIRIRATVITDFDRKDIIVPNKNFITGQLINWTLSDTVTRVVIKIGVAYGSDLEKTRQLMLEAAQNNPRVLDDPQPQVLFLEFADSTLNHELRIHVKELSDRNPAIDEINRYVDQRFKEEGIEIAFRQLDIHLRNSEGVEKLIASQTQG